MSRYVSYRDQLMDLGWRRFIPLALANIIVTAVVLWMRS